MPTVSVIIPAFNAAATLARTLASAHAQTLTPDEIVIVDDGSTDATADVAREWARHNRPITLVQQPNAGLGAARNRAVAESSGAYIAPLDADDLWHPHYLAVLTGALEVAAPSAGFAYARSWLIDEDDRLLKATPEWRVDGPSLYRLALVNCVGNGSAAVFRRDAVLEVGGYESDREGAPGSEDYLLQLKIAAKRPIVSVPNALVGYRQHATNLSRDFERMTRGRLAALEWVIGEMPDIPVEVLRWTAAEAYRAASANALMQWRFGRALNLLRQSFRDDALGTAADLMTRAASLARRTWRRPVQGVFPAVSLAAAGSPPDFMTARRLRMLSLREAVHRPSAASPS